MWGFLLVSWYGASPLWLIGYSMDDQMVVSRNAVAMCIAPFKEGGKEPGAPHEETVPKKFGCINQRENMGVDS